MTFSLRTRLLIGMVGGMLVLLGVFSFTVYMVIRRDLTGQFDSWLASTAQVLAASVEVDANQVEAEFAVQGIAEFNDPNNPANYQMWQEDGEVVAKSPLLGGDDLPHFHGLLGESVHKALRGRSGERPWRAVGTKFLPRMETGDPNSHGQASAEQALVLVVARDASTLYGQLDLLKWLLLGATALTVGLAFLVGVYVVRKGLGPLDSIAAEIAAIDEGDLGSRIGETSLPAEIVPIRDRLNGLLSRLEEAFERERRFTADAAHELRTPLGGLRSTIEVTLAQKREGTEYQKALLDCLAIVEGMQATATNLLTLRRIDANQMAFCPERLVVGELVECSWEPLRERALARRMTFENRVGGDLTVTSDRQSLSVVFSNLFDNAVEYGEGDGRIWTSAREVGELVEITVSNTGCCLSSEQAAHVFERFWRGDSSRSDAGVHCGLGLALVQRISEALDGSVAAEVQGGTFTVRLMLPMRMAGDKDHGHSRG